MKLRTLLDPASTAPSATVLVRLMAGGVFLSEGILKLVYTNQGVGRFTKLGFPLPSLMAHGIAAFEIIGGLMLIAGLYTRLVALGFSLEMVVAILTTKVALFLGTSPLPLPPAPPQSGIWAVLHETRSDYAQLLCCVFLVLVGAGVRSLDHVRSTRRRVAQEPDDSGAKRRDGVYRAFISTGAIIRVRKRVAPSNVPTARVRR